MQSEREGTKEKKQKQKQKTTLTVSSFQIQIGKHTHSDFLGINNETEKENSIFPLKFLLLGI